jgi:putative ABC transport system permease protein
VAIVNETLARRFPQGAVGQHLGYGTSSLQIVGVVRDSKYLTLGETIPPTVYLPFRQAYMPLMTLHVRTNDRPRTMARIVEEMRRLAPDAVVSAGTMEDAVAASVLPARIGAAATGALGGVAVILAMIGVYGLVSFAVTQRTREIGVRKALGASTADVVRLIVGSSATLCAIGLAPGLALGALGATALGGLLAGVSPVDPLTLLGVSVVIFGAAVAASLVPSLRAARQDPLVALRTE